MIPVLLGLVGVLVSKTPVQANCSVAMQNGTVQVHWTDNKTIVLPGCSASIELRSNPDNRDAGAAAYLKINKKQDLQHLFTVIRDGNIYWDKSGERIIYQDRNSVGQYRLMFFDINGYAAKSHGALDINSTLLGEVQKNLRPNDEIVRFWPGFVTWDTGDVVVSVGIATAKGETGSLTPSCVGYRISTIDLRILETISETDLKKKYGGECRELK